MVQIKNNTNKEIIVEIDGTHQQFTIKPKESKFHSIDDYIVIHDSHKIEGKKK